jgi:hypothetical protein
MLCNWYSGRLQTSSRCPMKTPILIFKYLWSDTKMLRRLVADPAKSNLIQFLKVTPYLKEKLHFSQLQFPIKTFTNKTHAENV